MVQGTMMYSIIHMNKGCRKDCRDDRLGTGPGIVSGYFLVYSEKTGIQETIP